MYLGSRKRTKIWFLSLTALFEDERLVSSGAQEFIVIRENHSTVLDFSVLYREVEGGSTSVVVWRRKFLSSSRAAWRAFSTPKSPLCRSAFWRGFSILDERFLSVLNKSVEC